MTLHISRQLICIETILIVSLSVLQLETESSHLLSCPSRFAGELGWWLPRVSVPYSMNFRRVSAVGPRPAAQSFLCWSLLSSCWGNVGLVLTVSLLPGSPQSMTAHLWRAAVALGLPPGSTQAVFRPVPQLPSPASASSSLQVLTHP